MTYPRTQTTQSVTWTVRSKVERCCAHGDRFFYAVFSRRLHAWNIYEQDGDILKNPVTRIGQVGFSVSGHDLSTAVLSVVAGHPVDPVSPVKRMTRLSPPRRIRMTTCPHCAAEQPRQRAGADGFSVQVCVNCFTAFEPHLGRLVAPS